MSTAKKGGADMDERERKHLHVLNLLSLRRLLVRELTEAEAVMQAAASTEIEANARRKPNKEYLHQFEHAMQEGLQTDLREFMPVQRFHALRGLEERAYKPSPTGHTALRIREDLSVESELQYGSSAHGDSRDTLHVCCDQGTVGHAAMQYCEQVLGLRMSIQCDIWHRLHNDLITAVSSSGCARARLDALHIMKLRRGPFQRAGNLGVLRCAAQLLKDEVPDQNPLWDILYGPVMAELGVSERCVEYGSDEHVRSSWHRVLSSLTTEGIGTNVKTSRWFAWEQRARKAASHRYRDMLLLMFLGAKRQWWSCWDSSPLHSAQVVFSADADEVVSHEQVQDEDPPDEPTHAAAAAASSSAAAAEPKSLSEAKRESVQRRSVVGSALQYCLRVLMHEETCRLWKALAWFALPLEEYVARSQTMCSTPEGSKQYWIGVARMGLSELVHAQLHHFTSFELAEHMELGSSSNLYSERLVSLEGRISSRLWTALLRLCAEVALTSLHLQLPPLSFLCLLPDAPATRSAEVSRVKNAWEAYERLEETAKVNSVQPSC
eukprot:1121622-Amphidinium_carterae.2